MGAIDALGSLDLGALVERLAARTPAPADLEPGQWIGLVELLTLHVSERFSELPRESWDTCSTGVTRVLESAVASGAMDHRESVVRRLNLSLVLLRKTPADEGFGIAEPRFLIELLLREIPVSIEEASRPLAAGWRSLDIARIRELRAAKNLLSPGLEISRLVSGGEVDERLKAWEELFPALP